jgi:hypothetical protein
MEDVAVVSMDGTSEIGLKAYSEKRRVPEFLGTGQIKEVVSACCCSRRIVV